MKECLTCFLRISPISETTESVHIAGNSFIVSLAERKWQRFRQNLSFNIVLDEGEGLLCFMASHFNVGVQATVSRSELLGR